MILLSTGKNPGHWLRIKKLSKEAVMEIWISAKKQQKVTLTVLEKAH